MSGSPRVVRGGSWGDYAFDLAAWFPGGSVPAGESVYVGFRVASLVPEPGTGLLGTMGLLGVLGLAASRRRRAN